VASADGSVVEVSHVTVGVGQHLLWGGFVAVLVVGLAVDLRAHRRQRDVVIADAVRWTAIWVGLALVCAAALWPLLGLQASLQFLAGYSVEWSLSVDNVLVFAALLGGLAVPARRRYVVLFYGSLGAIVLRLAFILAGSALLGRFGWLTYFFGAFLLVAAVRLVRDPAAGAEPEAGLPRQLPAFLRRLPASPLLITAAAVAGTDLAFATDSIPAVLGMTHDPFIAFASNAMAVLGLRSMYFVLEAAALRFRYLKPALVAILAFVGGKMLIDPLIPGDVPVALSLGVILTVLAIAVVASWLRPRRVPAATPASSTASNF